MNPLLQAALLSIVSALLMFLAGYLVNWGVWTQDAANQYVAAAGLGLIWAGYTWWKASNARKHLLAALAAPPGTTETELKAIVKAQAADGKAGGPSVGGAAAIVLAASLASGAGILAGCGGNLPPTISPAGQIAYQAKNVTDAASTALLGIELLTDQGLLPKPVAIGVIQGVRKVGLAGNALAESLRIFADSKGLKGADEIRTTIQAIQRAVTDALVLVPSEADRKRVQQILQPILDALSAILIPVTQTTDPLPGFDLASWTDLTTQADRALARLAP